MRSCTAEYAQSSYVHIFRVGDDGSRNSNSQLRHKPGLGAFCSVCDRDDGKWEANRPWWKVDHLARPGASTDHLNRR